MELFVYFNASDSGVYHVYENTDMNVLLTKAYEYAQQSEVAFVEVVVQGKKIIFLTAKESLFD